MTTIRELWVKLGANTDQSKVVAFDKALGNVKASAASLVQGMLKLTAAAGGLTFGLLKLVQGTANYADEAAKGAQRFGITTETFQEFDHAAKLTGTNMTAVGTGFKNLARRADEAARGNATAAEMFDRLGLKAEGANGKLKATDDLLMDLADEIQKTDDPTKQLGMAVEVLGRSGEAMLPMLRKGKKGIQELRDEAKDGVISTEAAAQFEEYNDNILRSQRYMMSWRNTLAIAVLPRLNSLVEGFMGWAKANQEVIKSKIEAFAQRVVKVIDNVVAVAKTVNEQVERWGGWEKMMKRLGAALAAIGILKFAASLGKLGIALKAATIAFAKLGVAATLAFLKPLIIGGLIIAVVAAIAFGINEFMTFMKGGDSMLGRFISRFGDVDKAREVFRRIGRAVQNFGRVAIAIGKLFVKMWVQGLQNIWMIAGPIIKLIAAAVVWLVKTITLPILSFLLDLFGDVFGGIAEKLEWLNDHWDAVMGAIKMMAEDAGNWIRDGIGAAIDWIMDKIDAMMSGIKKAGEIAKMFSPKNVGKGLMNIGSAFAPSSSNNPRTPASRNNSLVQHNSIETTVNAGSNASPADIANKASKKTSDELARQNRLAQAAFAGGEL